MLGDERRVGVAAHALGRGRCRRQLVRPWAQVARESGVRRRGRGEKVGSTDLAVEEAQVLFQPGAGVGAHADDLARRLLGDARIVLALEPLAEAAKVVDEA